MLPSQDGVPFAYKTFLGWCVVGPLTKTGKSRSISCNGIAVQDAATSKVLHHHFGFTHEVRDVSAKMLQEMYWIGNFGKRLENIITSTAIQGQDKDISK